MNSPNAIQEWSVIPLNDMRCEGRSPGRKALVVNNYDIVQHFKQDL
jgi:hypothetical protein